MVHLSFEYKKLIFFFFALALIFHISLVFPLRLCTTSNTKGFTSCVNENGFFPIVCYMSKLKLNGIWDWNLKIC